MRPSNPSNRYYRKKLVLAIASFFLEVSISATVDAHAIAVHEAITDKAVDRSNNFSYFLGAVFDYSSYGSNNPVLDGKNAKNWIKFGSIQEDYGSGLTQRAYNHFYNPINKEGLSDFIAYYIHPTSCNNSFLWAATPNITASVSGFNTYTNIYNWPAARSYEYKALTSSSKADRDTNFGLMFRSIGQVVHLLQDTSQPEHVRNTQHLDVPRSPWHSYLAAC